jgi:hypothetical protein
MGNRREFSFMSAPSSTLANRYFGWFCLDSWSFVAQATPTFEIGLKDLGLASLEN